MESAIRLLLGHLDLCTALVALLIGVLKSRKHWTRGRWAESTLISVAFWVMGIYGTYGFFLHLLFGDFIATQIGWPNSPFQYEVAYANRTIGILGFSSVWLKRRDYLVASMVAYGSWFFADGVGHIVSLVQSGNTAVDNTGTILFTDLLMPLIVALLVWWSRDERTLLKRSA